MNLIELDKKSDRLDKFLDHLNPDVRAKLGVKDTEYLERMRKAFGWRCNMFSAEQVRKMIMQEYDLEYSQACRVYTDMEWLFGKIEEIDKNALRRILAEYYHRGIQMALKNNNEDGVINGTDKLAKLHGLNETIPTLTPEQMMPARTVVYVEKAVIVNGEVKEVGNG